MVGCPSLLSVSLRRQRNVIDGIYSFPMAMWQLSFAEVLVSCWGDVHAEGVSAMRRWPHTLSGLGT
jgi:hypothetical protein